MAAIWIPIIWQRVNFGTKQLNTSSMEFQSAKRPGARLFGILLCKPGLEYDKLVRNMVAFSESILSSRADRVSSEFRRPVIHFLFMFTRLQDGTELEEAVGFRSLALQDLEHAMKCLNPIGAKLVMERCFGILLVR